MKWRFNIFTKIVDAHYAIPHIFVIGNVTYDKLPQPCFRMEDMS